MVKIFGAAWKCNDSWHIWLMTVLFGRDGPNNNIGDQQTLFMFILSDQIIIFFPADTFSRKQLIFRPHYKRNKYKLLEKRPCVSVFCTNHAKGRLQIQ